METPLCAELVARTLNFHGQPLQKLWETDLAKFDLSFSKEPDFEVYQQRQKHLSFQDRGKRQKLLQFIVNKANALFDPAVLELEPRERSSGDEGCYAVVPTYESFVEIDKQNKNRHIFEIVKPGDLIIGSILNKSVSGLLLKVLCIDGDFPRGVADLGIKAFCPMGNIIPAADKKSVNRTYMMNDTVCCEVLEVIPDTDKLVCGMKGTALPPGSPYAPRLGLLHSDDFPLAYKYVRAVALWALPTETCGSH